ncbi:MAG: PTS sugar transporter subunit IIA [Actinomyces ruminicola]|uniref:Ascorbate-specific PTS system EIIA component n=1 Tax=Actinomyces ruminicola TaxID=332524 RepID=A0A1G9UYR0_9ACTO|nr:PTS sugar transporter subunit IIA [Actinomyces ruminicola]MBE6482683.1 PTS sugar transporter subunit IIA [Actinomyces ruminicola]SDM65141.1 PTS system, ascorbate-specific IIA component [Actinomyces ruminicola]
MVTVDPSMLALQTPPDDWRDLMRHSAALLERHQLITPTYIDAVLAGLERNGAYMLIAPGVLLAHARPEEGALGTGLSLLTTTEDVALMDDPSMPIRLFFTLAANDSQEHLALLATLAETLMDSGLMNELRESEDPVRVAQILTPSES